MPWQWEAHQAPADIAGRAVSPSELNSAPSVPTSLSVQPKEEQVSNSNAMSSAITSHRREGMIHITISLAITHICVKCSRMAGSHNSSSHHQGVCGCLAPFLPVPPRFASINMIEGGGH